MVNGDAAQAQLHHQRAMAIFEMVFEDEPRGLRLLRQPMDNATLEAKVLSLSTQLVSGTYRTEYRR